MGSPHNDRDAADDDFIANLQPGLTAEQAAAHTSNLPTGQTALLLRILGQRRGANLQLGAIVMGTGSSVPLPEDGAETIWMFNNNARELEGAEMNHREGVELRAHSGPGGTPQGRSDSDTGPEVIVISSDDEHEKHNEANQKPNARDTGAVDWVDLWDALLEGLDQSERLDTDGIQARIFDILQPRVTSKQMKAAAHDPFIQGLAGVLRVLFQSLDDRSFISNDNARLIRSGDYLEWAVAIAQYVPTEVRNMVGTGILDPTNLPWHDTNDAGVYWLTLAPLLPHHHWHDYVGSATRYRHRQSAGLRSRRSDRHPGLKSSRVNSLFNNVRWSHRREYGDANGIPDDSILIDDLVWATLLVIPGSSEVQDARDALYNRWLCLIAEAAFHSWFGTYSAFSRNKALNISPFPRQPPSDFPAGNSHRLPHSRGISRSAQPQTRRPFKLEECLPSNHPSPLCRGIAMGRPKDVGNSRRQNLKRGQAEQLLADNPEQFEAMERGRYAITREFRRAEAARRRAVALEKKRVTARQYRANNFERNAEKQRQHRAKQVKDGVPTYYARRLAKDPSYREKLNAKDRQYRANNPEHYNERQRQRRAKQSEDGVPNWNARRIAKDPSYREKLNAVNRQYRANNREHYNERQRQRRAEKRERVLAERQEKKKRREQEDSEEDID